MSKYPELDASVEAGEELERWKERCHALETRLADFAQELHRQTMLAEYRKVRVNELEAEAVELRALLRHMLEKHNPDSDYLDMLRKISGAE